MGIMCLLRYVLSELDALHASDLLGNKAISYRPTLLLGVQFFCLLGEEST